MKKVVLFAVIALTLSLMCVSVSASEDCYVFDAISLYEHTTSGGGLALSERLLELRNASYISFYADGSVTTAVDGTQIQIKVRDLPNSDFLLKEYPIIKIAYVSDIGADSLLDFNLGLNYAGVSTRLWGFKPEFNKSGKPAELIIDASKSFKSGEKITDYSWKNVDENSPVNYIRLKPYAGNKALIKGEHFSIQYIGFFKTESDAKDYELKGGSVAILSGLDLNIKAVRKNVGEEFELTALPRPSFIKLDSVEYTSENTSVATVDANGKVTAVGAGDTNIIVKSKGHLVKCHVYVFAEKFPAVKFVLKKIGTDASVVVNALGDSITTYAPAPNRGVNYHDWWAKDFRVRNNDYGISGTMVSNNGSESFVARYPNMNSNADLVVVKGGTNDWGNSSLGSVNTRDDSTFRGALRVLMEGLIEKYPNKPIVFLTPIKRCESGLNNDKTNKHGEKLIEYANAVIDMGAEYGIPVIDVYTPEELDFTSKVVSPAGHDANGEFQSAVCESSLMPDGLHPSGDGHKVLAAYLLDALSDLGIIEVVDKERGSGFTDTLSHWGCDAIDFVVGRGLFNGVTAKTFEPNGTMTRGMLVTVLSRLGNDTANTTVYPFSDVAQNAWFAPGVSFAYANGIVDSADLFRPDENVTREELADMLYRYAKSTGKVVNLSELTFADAGDITAKDAVAYCVNAGIIKGYDDNTFKPLNSATRAEVATMIQRFVNAD